MTLADDDEASTRILLSAAPGRVAGGMRGRRPWWSRRRWTGACGRRDHRRCGGGGKRAIRVRWTSSRCRTSRITIAAGAGSASGAFTLEPDDDDVVEADETLAVSGTSELPVAGTSVTLADDDEASTRILLSATPGGSPRARVRRRWWSRRRWTGAAAGRDHRRCGGGGKRDPRAVDFEPGAGLRAHDRGGGGERQRNLHAGTRRRRRVEADETLAVSGTSELPVAGTSVTVADDDEGSTRIVLSAVPGRVSGGRRSSSVVVTADVERGLRQAATAVTVAGAGTGDPDAVDFDPVPGFGITIPANAASGTGTFELGAGERPASRDGREAHAVRAPRTCR